MHLQPDENRFCWPMPDTASIRWRFCRTVECAWYRWYAFHSREACARRFSRPHRTRGRLQAVATASRYSAIWLRRRGLSADGYYRIVCRKRPIRNGSFCCKRRRNTPRAAPRNDGDLVVIALSSSTQGSHTGSERSVHRLGQLVQAAPMGPAGPAAPAPLGPGSPFGPALF